MKIKSNQMIKRKLYQTDYFIKSLKKIATSIVYFTLKVVC